MAPATHFNQEYGVCATVKCRVKPLFGTLEQSILTSSNISEAEKHEICQCKLHIQKACNVHVLDSTSQQQEQVSSVLGACVLRSASNKLQFTCCSTLHCFVPCAVWRRSDSEASLTQHAEHEHKITPSFWKHRPDRDPICDDDAISFLWATSQKDMWAFP